MGQQVTIGGDRLGSGNRNKVTLHGYERSTHNLDYVWRSTMAPGTLVPFLTELALPGDTFDIELDVDVLTHPTIGPLFGSYKIQLDVFQIPIRLYNSKLHMNLLNVGLDMSKVALPQIAMSTNGKVYPEKPVDNQQINASSIFAYLNMRGVGNFGEEVLVTRRFNAVPWLGYWDIYKQYYANKQEEIGAVIHKDVNVGIPVLVTANLINNGNPEGIAIDTPSSVAPPAVVQLSPETYILINATGLTNATSISQINFRISEGEGPIGITNAAAIFLTVVIDVAGEFIYLSDPTPAWQTIPEITITEVFATEGTDSTTDTEPTITTFPLENIDTMKRNILQFFSDGPIVINNLTDAPYGLALEQKTGDIKIWSKQYSQEGLALKTYNSDLFNNWIETEWIDGTGGINEITAISTAGANFTLDELNLKQKIYNMLNRIAISGGSYEDWLSAVYDHEKPRTAENPMYLGGLIRSLVFEEVISNAASEDQPLGTLAGRGRVGNKRNGGQVTAKINEPSYIMGIVSLTPNIDYSQGNKWDTNLKTLDDLHKPALDEIGFQDLITDQMAWWDTQITDDTLGVVTFKSAGKQPAWINYMTNVNQVRGNFADQAQQMFMVLNRRYSLGLTGTTTKIQDLTTYIDPTKFNNIFADTRRDAQNFWTQIGIKMTARRKMSAKVIPNL